MAQDLRNLFKKDEKVQHITMSEGHEARFLDKLEKELPKQKSSHRFNFLSFAASAVILLGLSFGAYQFFNSTPIDDSDTDTIVENTNLKTLGDVSPDLKKVEDYYLASIHLELSQLELTPENKELVDGYIELLKELNEEYDKLTIELNDNGPNAETLDALIGNLKLRLNLVMRLKEKLQEFNDDSFVQKIS